jgi:hypothetical protein
MPLSQGSRSALSVFCVVCVTVVTSTRAQQTTAVAAPANARNDDPNHTVTGWMKLPRGRTMDDERGH